jgi:hypothetical protein
MKISAKFHKKLKFYENSPKTAKQPKTRETTKIPYFAILQKKSYISIKNIN